MPSPSLLLAKIKAKQEMKQIKDEQNTIINPSDILFIDGEFTQSGGELLSLSIVDYDGNTIFNRWYKPKVATSWPRTEAIHHISPEMVKDCQHVEHDKEYIQSVLDKAKYVVSMNIREDRRVLANEGINLTRCFDLKHFSYLLFGNENLSLKAVAEKLGYDVSLATWHRAQDDAFITYCLFLDLSTVYCHFNGIQERNPIRLIQLVKKVIKHVKYYKPKVAKKKNQNKNHSNNKKR